jgi:hypothetical protein
MGDDRYLNRLSLRILTILAVVSATQVLFSISVSAQLLMQGTYKNETGAVLVINGKNGFYTGTWSGEKVKNKPINLGILEKNEFSLGRQICKGGSKEFVCFRKTDGRSRTYTAVATPASKQLSSSQSSEATRSRKTSAEEQKAQKEVAAIEQRRLTEDREERKKTEAQQQAQRIAGEKAQKEAAAIEQRRLTAEREERRRIEAEQQAQRIAGERAQKEATARQASIERASRPVIVSPTMSIQGDDILARFSGAWVPTSPPGPQIFFNQTALSARVVNLPNLGQAIIKTSNGENGSNFQMSGQGFNCYYMVIFLRGNLRMVWDLKSGDAVCMTSNTYELAE